MCFAPTVSSEETAEEGRAFGGGAAREGGTRLVVKILCDAGGDREKGERQIYLLV